MKKIILVSFFSVIISLNGYCQNQLGIKGGYNYFSIVDPGNKYDPKDPENFTTYTPDKNSYTASLFINNWIDTAIFISYQINYLNYCFHEKSSSGSMGSSGKTDYHYNLNYFQFAFLPHIDFGKKWKFFIEPGVYINWLFYSHIKGTEWSSSAGISKYDTLDQSAGNNSVGFGFKAGLGLEIPINKTLNFLVVNSYSINIGSLTKGLGFNIFNATFEVGLSYNIEKFKILLK